MKLFQSKPGKPTWKTASWTVLVSVLLVSSCTGGVEDRASAIAGDFMRESGLPGLAVTIGRSGRIIYSEGFGFADLEQHVPVDPAVTRFRVGSTAKSMTAMAIAQLYDAGKLDLDAPIQTYLPDFPEKAAPITTRMLAGHLGGIRHYEGDEFFSDVAYESVSDALSIFADDPLAVLPGSAFRYSTYGYNLASAVVEVAAGEEFVSYMTENVFGPTGMTSTVADRVMPIIEGRSRYYHFEDGTLVNSPWVDNSNKWAGGGFLSTSEDLVRFAFAHLTDEHLKPDTIKTMWTSQKTSAGEETGYGIGWRIRTDEAGRTVIGHTGGSVGGTTQLRIYPDDDLVIAVITNTSGGDIGGVTDDIVNTFLSPEQ